MFGAYNHDILCHKLRALGITGKVGVWIKEFLTGRYQQVPANGLLSDSSIVISGIPQGTVLGPILFIIMISDLCTGMPQREPVKPVNLYF